MVAGTESFAKVPADTLRRLFEVLPGETICILLNACFSHRQAAAVAEVVPCAIGMTQAVVDHAATAFSAGFYEALAFGESIQSSFNIGVLGPELAQLHGHREVPKLFRRPDVDPSQLHLPGAQPNLLAARASHDSATELARRRALAGRTDRSLSDGTPIPISHVVSTSDVAHQVDRNCSGALSELHDVRLRFAIFEQTRNGLVTESSIGDGTCVFDGGPEDAAVLVGEIRELMRVNPHQSIRIIDERESFYTRLISEIEEQSTKSNKAQLTRFSLITRIEEIRKYHGLLIQGIRLIAADKSGWLEDLEWAGASLIGLVNYHHILQCRNHYGTSKLKGFDVFRSDLRLNGRFFLDELEAQDIAVKLVGVPNASFLVGGWCDLADFPREVQHGRVIPAIIWEILYASKRHDWHDLTDKTEALNFFLWRIGLA